MDGDTEDVKNLVAQTQKFSTGFSIYYELKMVKQDMQAGQFYNYIQEQKTKPKRNRDMH